MARNRPLLQALALSLSYLFLLLLFLDISPIGSSSEAREAHIVRSILTSSDWLLPSRNGIVPSKPLLFHWVGAGLSALTALPPEYATRLVSALSASLLMFITMRLAWRLYPNGDGGIPLVAGIALGTNYEFLRLSLDCRVDMLFSLLVFIALAAVLERVQAGKQSVIPASAPYEMRFWIASGLAVLTKGPLGVILPLLVGVLLLYRLGGMRTLRSFFVEKWVWIIPFLLLACPWYLYAAAQGNSAVLSRQLVFENVLRFFGGEYVNSRPFYYYFVNGVRASFPWFPLFLLLIPEGLRAVSSRERGPRGELFIVVAAVLIFFSAATGKRYSYLAPIFPVLALYCASSLSEVRFSAAVRRLYARAAHAAPRALIALLLTLIFLAGIVDLPLVSTNPFLSFARSFLERHVARIAVGASGVLVLSLLVERVRSWAAPIGRFVQFEFVFFALVFGGLGIRNAIPRFHERASAVRSMVSPETPLTVVRGPYDEYLDPILYHLERPVRVVGEDAKLDCKGKFLAKREWFETRSGEFMIEAELSQRNDEWKGRAKERDVMLLRCRDGSSGSLP